MRGSFAGAGTKTEFLAYLYYIASLRTDYVGALSRRANSQFAYYNDKDEFKDRIYQIIANYNQLQSVQDTKGDGMILFIF